MLGSAGFQKRQATVESEPECGSVLVVEGDALVSELIDRTLVGAGFKTRRASSAEGCLEIVREHVPDVVLLGARLPDCDGYELLSTLRARSALSGVSIAMMDSPGRDPSKASRALECGADDYLRKPIESLELVARARSLLRLRRNLAELQAKSTRLAELNAELERLAVRDALTGVHNRRYLTQRLGEEIERYARSARPLSLLVCDVDHFKSVNDNHGHAAGDEVLRGVAAALARSVRRVDLLARLGGEEFVIVAPSTPLSGALVLAERIRAAVEQMPVLTTNGSGVHVSLRVTISVGVVTISPGNSPAGIDGAALLAAADLALYAAKNNGRNRVEVSAGF